MTKYRQLTPALERFVELLDERLLRGVSTSETVVCCTFVVALIEVTGLKLHEVVFEERKNSKLGSIKTDISLFNFFGKRCSIEFKYHREIPSGWNSPLPQIAGLLFKDIFRLSQDYVPEAVHALFVYLTSDEMTRYLSSPSNGLVDFFDLPVGWRRAIDETYLALRSQTLRRSAGVITPCTVEALFSCRLCNDHRLRVYGVTPA
jgi:hypothetical protein